MQLIYHPQKFKYLWVTYQGVNFILQCIMKCLIFHKNNYKRNAWFNWASCQSRKIVIERVKGQEEIHQSFQVGIPLLFGSMWLPNGWISRNPKKFKRTKLIWNSNRRSGLAFSILRYEQLKDKKSINQVEIHLLLILNKCLILEFPEIPRNLISWNLSRTLIEEGFSSFEPLSDLEDLSWNALIDLLLVIA